MSTKTSPTSFISWEEIKPFLDIEKNKDFLENIDSKTLQLILDENSKSHVVESVLKMLKKREPENATQEYAEELAELMKKTALNFLEEKDKQYLKLAVEQARKSVDKGGFPAGAIVVKDGKIISEGISIGYLINDPTSHAETASMREACQKLETSDLTGSTLYASLHPCLMCFSVANWSGISRIVYGCRKTEDMVQKRYYEGVTDVSKVNEENTRKIEIVCIPDYELEMLDLIKVWEDKFLT
ncbi:nucleoside deaminase [Candidatus Roizmanbacteria bacterium]|nr:MAG: nucleoside deaminase [Candidatus Roizmanbacteria bacterium]